MVLRHDMNLETMGKVAELLDDMSPFQVGTMGTYEGKHFTLIGRIKAIYDAGSWSEWLALFDDGSEGWLAEAQGFYAMTFKLESPSVQYPSKLEPLAVAVINDVHYRVEDLKVVRYVGTEGELPYTFKPNEQVTSVDFQGPQLAFASLAIHSDRRDLFLGRYLDFEEFKFQNLRTLDGWN
jgi:hypothetical protein